MYVFHLAPQRQLIRGEGSILAGQGDVACGARAAFWQVRAM